MPQRNFGEIFRRLSLNKMEAKLLVEEKTTQALPIEEINQLTKTLVDTMANGKWHSKRDCPRRGITVC